MNTLIISPSGEKKKKKGKLEKRVSFRPQLLSSAIWLVDFSAHGNDKLKVLK